MVIDHLRATNSSSQNEELLEAEGIKEKGCSKESGYCCSLLIKAQRFLKERMGLLWRYTADLPLDRTHTEKYNYI